MGPQGPTCSPKALHLPSHDALRELRSQGIVVAGGSGLQPIDGQQQTQGNLAKVGPGCWRYGRSGGGSHGG